MEQNHFYLELVLPNQSRYSNYVKYTSTEESLEAKHFCLPKRVCTCQNHISSFYSSLKYLTVGKY